MNEQTYQERNDSFYQETPESSAGPSGRVGAEDEPIILEATVEEMNSEPQAADVEATPTVSEIPTPLINPDLASHYRKRWKDIQGKFVDEPRATVEQADALVAEVIADVTQMLSSEHNNLEDQWSKGYDVSTEDLRVALQRYRTFFNRLVV